MCGEYKEKRKVTYSSGGYETEIDFVLLEKESRKFLKDVKVTSQELQHRLVVVDVKKESLFKCIKMKQNMQWKIWKSNEKETKEKFKKVKELVNSAKATKASVDTKAKDLWSSFKDWVLETCKELCGKTK